MSLSDEVNSAIRHRNYDQAIFLLALSQNIPFSSKKFTKLFTPKELFKIYKYNLLLLILHFEKKDYSACFDYMDRNYLIFETIQNKLSDNSDSFEELYFNTVILTFHFYQALCYDAIEKYSSAINVLKNLLKIYNLRKTFSEISNVNEHDYIDKILSHYLIVFDQKYIHSFLGELKIKDEDCHNAVIHFKKSIHIFNSFKFLYENLYITTHNATKYHYQNVNEEKKTCKSSELTIEERTANNFKLLRNDLLVFISKPELTNSLVSKHKSIIQDMKEKNVCVYVSIFFLQAISKILFHNYRIDDSNNIFNFLHDTKNLSDECKVIWSTVLWLKKDKNRLGILAVQSMTYEEESYEKNHLSRSDNAEFELFTKKQKNSLKNENHFAWLIIANYFSAYGDHNRSVICLEKSISIKKYSYSFLLLGHEYMIRNENEKAIFLFNQTLRMNSNSYSAIYGIGSACSRIHNYKFNDFDINDLACISKTELGKQKNINDGESSVVHFFKRAISIVPLNKAVRYQLIRFLVQRQEFEYALKEIFKFFRISISKKKLSENNDTNINIFMSELKNYLLDDCKRSVFAYCDYDVFVALELIDILSNVKEYQMANQILMILPIKSDNRYKKRRRMVEIGLGSESIN